MGFATPSGQALLALLLSTKVDTLTGNDPCRLPRSACLLCSWFGIKGRASSPDILTTLCAHCGPARARHKVRGPLALALRANLAPVTVQSPFRARVVTMTGADSGTFQGVGPECQSLGSRPQARSAGRNRRGSRGLCLAGWLPVATGGSRSWARRRRNGVLCLRSVLVSGGCGSLGVLRDVGKVQAATIPGVSQLDETIEGGAVVAAGFQCLDQGIGEVRFAAGQVVARVVGAHFLQVVEAVQEGVKKAFQSFRGECRGRARALEGKRKVLLNG